MASSSSSASTSAADRPLYNLRIHTKEGMEELERRKDEINLEIDNPSTDFMQSAPFMSYSLPFLQKTPFMRACADGYIDIVEKMLDLNADISITNGGQQTVFHLAAVHRNEPLAKILWDHASKHNLTDLVYQESDQGNTPARIAAAKGDVKILELFWKPGMEKQKNRFGDTALHRAAHFVTKDGVEIVKFLVQHGADKNSLNDEGCIPFHYAAVSGQVDVMKELCDSACFVHTRDNKSRTPLHYAAEGGNAEAIEFLLDKGALVNVTDVEGNSPLHDVAKGCHFDAMKVLLRRGAFLNPNIKGLHALDLLRSVAPQRLNEAVKSICEVQSSPSIIKAFLRGPDNNFLHYLAGYGEDAHLRPLAMRIKSNKESLDAKNNKHESPAHWAAQTGNAAILQTLASFEVNLEAKDKNGHTPLDLALANQHDKFGRELLQILGKGNPERWLKKWSDEKKQNLISDRKFLNSIETELRLGSRGCENVVQQMPILWITLYLEQKGMVQFILEYCKGAVNEIDVFYRRTTLHWATILGKKELVITLCRQKEFKEDLLPNLQDRFHKTAMNYALEKHHDEIVTELLELKTLESYKDRQVYVDGANAILVGAALIASVTFQGLLQPPLNAKEDAYARHIGVRIFWTCNSLSFFFAIATVLTGAETVLPMYEVNIARAVVIIRRRFFYTAILLACSVAFVLMAFAAAGFAILPSLYRWNITATVCIGGTLCSYILGQFLLRLSVLRWGHQQWCT